MERAINKTTKLLFLDDQTIHEKSRLQVSVLYKAFLGMKTEACMAKEIRQI